MALINGRLTYILCLQKTRPDNKVDLSYFKAWICWLVLSFHKRSSSLCEYTSKWDIGRSFDILNSGVFKKGIINYLDHLVSLQFPNVENTISCLILQRRTKL